MKVGDICDGETATCQANSGSTLLTKIVFTSAGCDDCTVEGVNMSLTGDSTQFPQPSCETVDLDHPLQEDFLGRSTFSASPEELSIGWEDCWRVR